MNELSHISVMESARDRGAHARVVARLSVTVLERGDGMYRLSNIHSRSRFFINLVLVLMSPLLLPASVVKGDEITQGQRAAEAGDYKRALKKYKRYIRKHPRRIIGHQMLAELLEEIGQHDEAYQSFRKAFGLREVQGLAYDDFRLDISWRLFAHGEYEEVVNVLAEEKIVSGWKSDYRLGFLVLRGMSRLMLGDLDDGRVDLENYLASMESRDVESVVAMIDSKNSGASPSEVDSEKVHAATLSELSRLSASTKSPSAYRPMKSRSTFTSTSRGCCKICRSGKACGDSCISYSETCNKPLGCACNG